ncbi:cytidine deaminase, partial [bacterium]|nr:cytidine deaminase [bacterium]
MKNDPTPEQRELLIETARQVRKWAYAPYSHYMVGAALLTTSGKVYDGVNVENAVYPLTTCAERTAIVKAVSEGEKDFLAMAIVTDNAGAPCGSCRQVMAEFGLEMLVIIADTDGVVCWEKTVAELLPE